MFAQGVWDGSTLAPARSPLQRWPLLCMTQLLVASRVVQLQGGCHLQLLLLEKMEQKDKNSRSLFRNC